MFKPTSIISTLVVITLLVVLVSADDSPVEVITKDKLGLTIPNPFGTKPIFETNDQQGRLVALHLP